MNYRHIYHAGNFADVYKHIVLLWILDYLKKKDKPFFALDTHAGIGRYDFSAEQAQKTKEFSSGIGKLKEGNVTSAPLVNYLDIIAGYNAGADSILMYPGSPELIASALRGNDRAVVNELHPEDVRTLCLNMRGYRNITIDNRDAYECLKALLPPPQRRGMVLIDPPFEVIGEFDLMVRGVKQALKRWANGIYLLWYPIKSRRDIEAFHEEILGLEGVEALAADLYLRAPHDVKTLNGCGLVIINPPWGLRDSLELDILPALVQAMCEESGYFEIK